MGLIRKQCWNKYRSYAWLGFWMNYVFLLLSLLASVIDDRLYVKEEVLTYAAYLDDAELLIIHPSAVSAILNKERLKTEIQNAIPTQMDIINWYQQVKIEQISDQYQKERFPYLLSGIKFRWGYGLAPTIFAERDGLGILIATEHRHYYFRTQETFLDWSSP